MLDHYNIPQQGLFDYLTRQDELQIKTNQLLERQIALLEQLLDKPAVINIPDSRTLLVRIAQPHYDVPILKLNDLTTTDTYYQVISEWKVNLSRERGVLSFIEIDADNFTHCVFKITIGSYDFENIRLGSAISMQFPDVILAPGTDVNVSVKSDDGSEIKVYAEIIGKEVLR